MATTHPDLEAVPDPETTEAPAPVRRIKIDLKLEQRGEGRTYGGWDWNQVVATDITIELPTPNDHDLPAFVARQVAGLLGLADVGTTPLAELTRAIERRGFKILDLPGLVSVIDHHVRASVEDANKQPGDDVDPPAEGEPDTKLH